MSRLISSFGLLLCSLLPAMSMAHPGDHSFLAGATHPLGGLDHLLAWIAVALLAVITCGAALALKRSSRRQQMRLDGGRKVLASLRPQQID